MSTDIYEVKVVPEKNRKKHQAVSQRRDEYLRATGGEAVPHRRHRHHHASHRQSSGWIFALFGLGMLALLVAGALWWQMSP